MKQKTILIIAAIAVIVAIAAYAGWYIFRPGNTSVKKGADFELNATELVNAFEMNEEDANAKYLGKIIQVTGRVDDITIEKEVVTVTLKNAEDISGVICSFDGSSYPEEELDTGQTVSIKGICSGYLLDVVLNKCTVVK